MVTSHACTWTRRAGRNLMSKTDRQQLFFQLRNKLQPLWTAPVISSYVVRLHCNDVKEWSLWNLIKQFVTLSKQTSDFFFYYYCCFVLWLGRKQKFAWGVRGDFELKSQKVDVQRERETLSDRTAWPGKAAQLFFPPRSQQVKTCSLFLQRVVELLAALSFQPLTLCATEAPGGPGGLAPLPCSCGGSHTGSGGNHAFVPLAVGHGAPVVIGHTALVGLLLASVQEGLRGLALAFWFAHHVVGTLRPHAARREYGWATFKSATISTLNLLLSTYHVYGGLVKIVTHSIQRI